MAQNVSASFLAAQTADTHKLAYSAQLILGDYASSAAYGASASSSGDFSADYPAAGAIDGDRTELNIGPASGADNGVGKSSWKSSGQPDTGASVWLVIDFGTTRTINRIKLYHRSGHGITSYLLEYWDGATWVTLPGGGAGLGYGLNPYGTWPFGDPTSYTGSGTLDTVDFADITTTKIRLTPLTTAVAHDYAEVVALEAYRLLDISDRVTGLVVDRQRDYKLNNNLASTCDLTLNNSDRFFSPSHLPTAAEVAAGFVNQELRPGLGVIVKLGFSYGSVTELVPAFTGTIDSLTLNSANRTAKVQARDGMKSPEQGPSFNGRIVVQRRNR